MRSFCRPRETVKAISGPQRAAVRCEKMSGEARNDGPTCARDFPKESDQGSVTGVQPKLLVREVDGRYQSVLAEEELWVRYEAGEDLASQLSA